MVDVVGVISESDNPRNYWKVLKHRLKKEGNESVTNCNQLKLKSIDGKYYNIDVVDIEGMFRIIESIPSKKAITIEKIVAKNVTVNELFIPAQRNYASVGFKVIRERENKETPFSGKCIDYEMIIKK